MAEPGRQNAGGGVDGTPPAAVPISTGGPKTPRSGDRHVWRMITHIMDGCTPHTWKHGCLHACMERKIT
eukprot:363784-Chlamydomonas_euryale.AAC.8